MLACPFIGLQPYADEHRDYFFGRDRERRLIAANLYASKLTILYGPSGVGKTSILRAGVAGDLAAAPRTIVVYFSDWHGEAYLDQLKRRCLDAAGQSAHAAVPLADAAAPLDELLAALQQALDCHLLILLDQFEEYFVYHDHADVQHPFESELARIVNRTDLQASVLIALRDDRLARLDRFRARIPNLLSNALRLAHLDTAAGRDAILKPLALWNDRHPEAGAGIEEPLIGEILHEVQTPRFTLSESAGQGEAPGSRHRDEIETACLQLVLTELWDAELGQLPEAQKQAGIAPFLRLATYRALGGAASIFQAYLYARLDRLLAADQQACARMFPHLVTPSGTKIAYATRDLVYYAQRLHEKVQELLRTLVDQRILRRIEQPERYEIFHDVLAPGILAWCARYLEAEQQAELLAEERQRTAAREQAALERERHNRRVAILVMVGAVVVILLLGIAMWYNRRAHLLLREAVSTRLLANADRLQETSFDLSLLLNVEAIRVTATNDAAAGLLRHFTSRSQLSIILYPPEEHGLGDVTGIAFTGDGTKVAAGGSGGVALWDVRTGRWLPKPAPEAGNVRSFCFSPDGHLLATAGKDGTVKVWDPSIGRRWATIQGSEFAFSGDGTRLAVAGEPGVVQIWDMAHIRPDSVMQYDPYLGRVRAFSPALDQVLLQNATRLTWWDMSRQRSLIPPLVLPQAELRQSGISLARNGTRVAVANVDQTVTVWDLVTGKKALTFGLKVGAVDSFALNPDGTQLALASNGNIVLWDVYGSRSLTSLKRLTDRVDALAFSADGKSLVSAASGRIVMVWKLDSALLAALEEQADETDNTDKKDDTEQTQSLAFAADRTRSLIACGSSIGAVTIWDAKNHSLLAKLPPRRGNCPIQALAFRPGDDMLAIARGPHVELWDLASRRWLPSLEGHVYGVESLTFSPDGTFLVSASRDGVNLWDKRGQRHTLFASTDRTGSPIRVAVSSDGKLLASTGGTDHSILLWDLLRHRWLAPLRGHGEHVTSLAFSSSPFGRRLVLGNDDGTLTIWDLTAGKSLGSLTAGTQNAIQTVAVSPDGRLMASGATQRATLWDAVTFQSLATLESGHGAVTFSPDGAVLAAAASLHPRSVTTSRGPKIAALLWSIDLAGLPAKACKIANRNLTCLEWRQFNDAETPYHKTCAALQGPVSCP